ncbi:Sperm-associated antigen 17 [Acropora cervicornis]|uniref:Sperm-associated antigen 17 n=1 Tax=Acropora cervicornis TaxID=6130 RepID=A0AAD9R1E4_ACRCE|nr:Sperm-associated antigen 17 [Acropora cervicornis]
MAKSRRGKSASTNELSKWESELIQAPFNEETWRSFIYFIVPNKLEDNVFIDVLSEVVGTGLRKLFSIITFDGLLRDVKEFAKGASTGGKSKGASSGKPPPFFEVCEQIKPLVDHGEPIPPLLMAKLLKFKLLHIKQKDLERREEERKAAKAAEAGKKDEKGKKGGRSPSAGKRSKSPGKKKGKKDADLPPSPKKDTKLKRRGDVEDTFKSIDDEPDDEGSPQHYILIHGILTASVILHLSEIGVNVDAIICVKAQSYKSLTPLSAQQDESKEDNEENAKEEDSYLLDKEIQDSEEKAKILEAESTLNGFWSESESIVLKAPSGHKLKDIARYEVTVKESVLPEGNLEELDTERKTEFGTAIFEDVADVCYNMLDHLEQYKHYLDSMKLVRVPVHFKASASGSSILQPVGDPGASQSAANTQPPESLPSSLPVEADMRYYKHLISSIPPHSQSVPLILHCLLEQVTAIVDENNPLDQVVPPRADGLNHDLAAYIFSKTSKLALPENEKQAVTEIADSKKLPKLRKSPVILHYNDTLTSRLHHLEPANGLDPEEAELHMLNLFPQSHLKELPTLHGRDIVEREARANELRHFCKSHVETNGFLDRAMKQFAFEGMLLKAVNENGDIVDLRKVDESFASYANLWDHPYCKLSEFQALRFPSDDSERVNLESHFDSSPLSSFRNIDEWCVVEHFDQKTFIQVLEAARLTHPYMDTYYHKRDHSLLLALHNPIGPNKESRLSWSTKLHSNVGFRNYLEHVLSSIGDWVQEQERLRQEAARTPTPPPPAPEQPSIPLKVGSRYGLMTRQELALIKAEEDEKSKKKGKKSARGTRSPKRSAKSREKSPSPEKKDDKDKKRQGSAASRQKSATDRSPSAKASRSIKSASSKADKRGLQSGSRSGDFEESEPLPVEEPNEEPYAFIGYDTGDNLVHVSGSLSTMFPADGAQIQVNKSKYVQGAKSVSTSVFKDGNMFVLHFSEPIDEILANEKEERLHEKDGTERLMEKTGLRAEEVEKSEVEASEKEQQKRPTPFCDFSSFVAELSDGMIVALSGYGPSGSLAEKDTRETEDTVTGHLIADPPPPQPTPSPQPKAGSPKLRKKADEEAKRLEEMHQHQEEERIRLEEEARRKAAEEKRKKPFQHVYITCPDGQHVQYLNGEFYPSKSDMGGVVVRQSYPVKPLGAAREKPAAEETSRTVMTDGTVIKILDDGSVQVLFPDGAVSKCQSYPIKASKVPVPSSKPSSAVSRPDPSLASSKKNLRGPPALNQKPSEEPLVPAISVPEKVSEWSSTGVKGNRIVTGPEGGLVTVPDVHCSLATCPQSGQVLKTREDNVMIVERPDDTRIVEHADGTRITTFWKQGKQELRAPDSETGEEAEYCDVTKMFVKVECPGFSTLTFDSEWGSCETVWGNGSRLHTRANGVSVMNRPDGSRLHVGAKGVVTYWGRDTQSSKLSDLSEPALDSSGAPEGVYIMRTTSQLCCEITDTKGTHFTVMSNGEMTVENTQTEPVAIVTDSTSEEAGSEKKVNSEPGPIQQAPVSPLVPRFFVIHADGTGSELLRHVDVKEFLDRAEDDLATAVLKSPLEGHPDVMGLTIIKPYSGGTSKIWLKEKDDQLIIPQGLRERDFKQMPPVEFKKQGPAFGINAGQGLNIGSSVKPMPPPQITCPQTIEFRQLIQYKPLTKEQRGQILKAMDDYKEYLGTRETELDRLLPKDPRDESEKCTADSLVAEVRLREEAKEAKLREEQGMALKDEIRNAANTLSKKTQNEDIRSNYVKEIRPDPVPQPPPPKWKRSPSEWERDRIELAELNYGKHALRYKEVPPYFETSQGQEFLGGLYNQRIPNMEALTSELAYQSRHPPPGGSSLPETPDVTVHNEISTSDQTDREANLSTETSNSTNGDVAPPSNSQQLSATPNDMRPTNPTPGHASGNGTPTPLRPTNPTPLQASTADNPRPSNPTPKQASEILSQESPIQEGPPHWTTNLESVQEVAVPPSAGEDVAGPIEAEDPEEDGNIPVFSAEMSQIGARSLYFDVTGEARNERVKMPNCILGGKPGALPNTPFLEIENPVRRRVHTVSVAGGNQERIDGLRGFELLPPQVSFGVLKEGCTYVCSVSLRNVGIDSCRYKVKQPPPSTGLRVLYKPGPVAAGMNTVLDVEIFAVAVGVVGESGLGHVGHHVEIVTETDILYLPVTANILLLNLS